MIIEEEARSRIRSLSIYLRTAFPDVNVESRVHSTVGTRLCGSFTLTRSSTPQMISIIFNPEDFCAIISGTNFVRQRVDILRGLISVRKVIDTWSVAPNVDKEQTVSSL